MAGYVKMFQSILDSTIWKQPATITKVWLTMMAMADRDGIVQAAIPGLADRAHVTVATAEKALALFLAPDPYSKTPDFEGRRIEVVRGGWRLLTYEMHREMMSAEDQRSKNADRQQRWRDRQRNARVTAVTVSNGQCDISESDPGSSLSAPRGSGSESDAGAGSKLDAGGPLTGYLLCKLFGQVRSREIGGMPWQGIRDANGKASTMAEDLNEDPSARADVEPTMVLLFKLARLGKAGNRSADILAQPAFGFAAWCSQFTALREQLHGSGPVIPDAAKPTAPGAKPWLAAEKAEERRRGEERAQRRLAQQELDRQLAGDKAAG